MNNSTKIFCFSFDRTLFSCF
ncbi:MULTISPECIES: hypothetical protein [Lactococcus]|uniref:Uncharacterized protein n=1 Tax=Lactococcus lactis TaxID=1358 RepID=A0A9X4NDV3_9LACT|nr:MULTISPECIES: hypothetical protein [Lactococcus]MCA2390335.1 hypothetical protein [Lactococcus sp. NH2-7C]MDG4968909.1 hypothetical protein [Lactococcus lactis]MDG4975714.1 hypothetical protein [Lactococcus lactis]MDG4981944.1 hypothetical protein [Lactococcus lactis]MDG5103004.1 hypothetical protein [Lactococcus lactis]